MIFHSNNSGMYVRSLAMAGHKQRNGNFVKGSALKHSLYFNIVIKNKIKKEHTCFICLITNFT